MKSAFCKLDNRPTEAIEAPELVRDIPPLRAEAMAKVSESCWEVSVDCGREATGLGCALLDTLLDAGMSMSASGRFT